MLKVPSERFPNFFRVRQTFATPRVEDISSRVQDELRRCELDRRIAPGQSIAISAGSRGIHNIDLIMRAVVDFCKSCGGAPFIVPAMGSHAGATAEGQQSLLARYGITEVKMGCPIRSSMDTEIVCTAAEGFPVHFDRNAFHADHVIVVNRIKPHTRFNGAIESGLMKMMLIGLGKHAGALVYHRVIMTYSFDQIVRSVAREVIARCKIAAGLAILENADEETADIVAIRPEAIETEEANQLQRVRGLLPKLPFDRAELLIIDEIGKEISGTGMDTNVIGRKFSDHYYIGREKPEIHNIYIRRLTEKTHGNATGIGIAEFCHRRVLEQIDLQATRVNCLTGGHAVAAMLPMDLATDKEGIGTALTQCGWGDPEKMPVMWIRNTLKLREVECSELYWEEARHRPDLTVLTSPRPLDFDQQDNLIERF
jgi:Domain of unknown function (DUF362)